MRLKTLLLTFLLLLSTQALRANDAFREFSIAKNPNGIWSYGYSISLGGAFNLYPEAQPNYLGVQGTDIWNAGPNLCSDQRAPEVGRIQEQLFIGLVPVPADTLYVHPGCAGQYTIVRWTAPIKGTYTIRGSFSGLVGQISTTDVHILLDSTTAIFDQDVNGPGDAALFDFRQKVSAGSTVDFAVGFGNDADYSGDSMGLQLTIDLLVDIDIKPGQFPNIVQPNVPGTLPVAILSSPTFNAAARVDTTSLHFGRIGDEQSLEFRGTQTACASIDVNGDGRLDLLCQFSQKKTGFELTDSVGTLTGKTFNGVTFKGSDSINVQ